MTASASGSERDIKYLYQTPCFFFVPNYAAFVNCNQWIVTSGHAENGSQDVEIECMTLV